MKVMQYKGYAVSLCYSDKEISAMEYTDEVDKPLRFIQSRDKAFALVESVIDGLLHIERII